MESHEVISAEHRGGHRIRVTFDDGLSKTVDFQRWLRGPVFAPLKKVAFFRRFFLEAGTLVWPNGADIAPEALRAAPPVRGIHAARLRTSTIPVRRRSVALTRRRRARSN